MNSAQNDAGSRRPERALAMMEVLATIAIVSLLIGLLLPSLGQARQQARRLGCASNLRGMGNALNVYRSTCHGYPEVEPPRANDRLASIGKVAELLVRTSLGDPRMLYCPVSLQDDPHATPPYTLVGTDRGESWRSGEISYIYLSGVGDRFPDAVGTATFDPAQESPDGVNGGHVLLGDRTVELKSGHRGVPGSNHGREGGWFYFVAGNVEWWGWERLAPHPSSTYIWYWPRVTAIPGGPRGRLWGHPLGQGCQGA